MGYTPYRAQRMQSPMRQDVSTGNVSTEDISQTNPGFVSNYPTNSTNPTNPTNTGSPDIVMLDSDYEGKDPVVTEKRGLRFWKRKQNASPKEDRYKFTGKDRQTGDSKNAHGVRSGDTYKGKFAMNQGDQKEIQKQINKQGHFGDIPPSLMKGYGPRNSPSYRARVAEINDHHEYLVNFDRFDKGRGKHDLHQQLSRKRPENFSSRFTDFEGNNTYDERGNVRRKYGRG